MSKSRSEEEPSNYEILAELREVGVTTKSNSKELREVKIDIKDLGEEVAENREHNLKQNGDSKQSKTELNNLSERIDDLEESREVVLELRTDLGSIKKHIETNDDNDPGVAQTLGKNKTYLAVIFTLLFYLISRVIDVGL